MTRDTSFTPQTRRKSTDAFEGFEISQTHRDYELLRFLHSALLRHAGGLEKFKRDIPRLLRQAIDEVIDTPRSRRYTISELEKTEKTYIGTKIEILLRNHLQLERGEFLDLDVDGVEVDVKNTVRVTWTIPNEALGHPCILIGANEQTALCQFGLIVIHEDILNLGRNRDQKTTIKKEELRVAHWILKDFPYPPSFWQQLSPAIRKSITSPRGGTDRVAMLFRVHQRQPISRSIVESLAQQKDYMKRIRKNGGARDVLRRERIALLSGKKHDRLIDSLGLQRCTRDEFISLQPESTQEQELLIDAGELDVSPQA